MDTGAVAKTQLPSKADAGPSAQTASNDGPETVREAAGRTVPPAEQSKEGLRFDDSAKQKRAADDLERARSKIDRRTVIDEETETVLFQLVEKSTGEVKQQFPDDVLLSLREYARENIADRQPKNSEEPSTSRSA